MNIEFEDKALEELFLKGQTNDSRYKRLPKDVVKRYVKVVNYLRAASRVETLFQINSLHYEKKRGDLKTSPDAEGIIVNALITEISKHYE